MYLPNKTTFLLQAQPTVYTLPGTRRPQGLRHLRCQVAQPEEPHEPLLAACGTLKPCGTPWNAMYDPVFLTIHGAPCKTQEKNKSSDLYLGRVMLEAAGVSSCVHWKRCMKQLCRHAQNPMQWCCGFPTEEKVACTNPG